MKTETKERKRTDRYQIESNQDKHAKQMTKPDKNRTGSTKLKRNNESEGNKLERKRIEQENEGPNSRGMEPNQPNETNQTNRNRGTEQKITEE